jgi:phosphatidylglycerophosphate synthase
MTNHEAIATPPAIAQSNDDGTWHLVLDSPASHDGAAWTTRRLLGLPIALRLALTAQAAGARGVVLTSFSARDDVRAALRDERLKIPVLDAADSQKPADSPSDGRRAFGTPIHVAANTVIHRALLGLSQRDPGPFGFDPIAVVDRATFDVAERAVLRSLRKPQDGWTSTYLNRPISLSISRRLVATSFRPNQVSVAILGVGLLGAFLASRGTYASLALGALLFHAQSVLDGCDGEMSRLTFRGSHTGEWLDTIGDDLTNYGFFGGAAWGLYTSTGRTIYLALGGFTVFCGLVGSGLEYRYLIKIGSGDLLKYPLGVGKAPGAADGAAKSAIAKAFDAIAPLFKRDTFVFLTLVGAVCGVTGPLLAIFAAGAAGVLVAVLKAELRMAKERAAQGVVDPVLPCD